MSIHVRQFGNPDGPALALVAGFGDHGGMFEALASTGLGARFALHAIDLPGTGNSEPLAETLTLDRAASVVVETVAEISANVIVGHSVGSIVASLVASEPSSDIETVLSLEGNLTAADAYFSGSAAGFDEPEVFHADLLAQLDERAENSPVVRRYRDQVERAEPRSIWELGCDTHRFSTAQSPGTHLVTSAKTVVYIYNPANTPQDSLDWIKESDLRTFEVNASHWSVVDQPVLLSDIMLDILETSTHDDHSSRTDTGA